MSGRIYNEMKGLFVCLLVIGAPGIAPLARAADGGPNLYRSAPGSEPRATGGRAADSGVPSASRRARLQHELNRTRAQLERTRRERARLRRDRFKTNQWRRMDRWKESRNRYNATGQALQRERERTRQARRTLQSARRERTRQLANQIPRNSYTPPANADPQLRRAPLAFTRRYGRVNPHATYGRYLLSPYGRYEAFENPGFFDYGYGYSLNPRYRSRGNITTFGRTRFRVRDYDPLTHEYSRWRPLSGHRRHHRGGRGHHGDRGHGHHGRSGKRNHFQEHGRSE